MGYISCSAEEADPRANSENSSGRFAANHCLWKAETRPAAIAKGNDNTQHNHGVSERKKRHRTGAHGLITIIAQNVSVKINCTADSERRRSRGQKSDREIHTAQASVRRPPKRRTGSPASVTDQSSLELQKQRQTPRKRGFAEAEGRRFSEKRRRHHNRQFADPQPERGEAERPEQLRTLKDIGPQVKRKRHSSRGMKRLPKARAGTVAERLKEGRDETAEAGGSGTAGAAERAEARTAAVEVEG
ncbi:hypothetical protein AOLI_G00173680 [Acnodon oligacanthus]